MSLYIYLLIEHFYIQNHLAISYDYKRTFILFNITKIQLYLYNTIIFCFELQYVSPKIYIVVNTNIYDSSSVISSNGGMPSMSGIN